MKQLVAVCKSMTEVDATARLLDPHYSSQKSTLYRCDP